jgi:hypothetical protein
MTNDNDKTYNWSFSDVRSLDNRLAKLEISAAQIAVDVQEIKNELAIKNHVVVDNREKPDWKAIAILIGATVGAIYAAVQQVIK